MGRRSPSVVPAAPSSARVDELELRGSRTRLWIYGNETARPRLVFLHGLRGDHHGLAAIVAHLPDVQVVVPDLPGFGESARLLDDRHDVDGYAAWVRDLLRVVAPDGNVVLAGHSFGSVVAAATVAAGAPVGGLVLVNPIAAATLATPPTAVRLTLLYHRLAAALPERPGTAMLRSRLVTRVASAAMVRTEDRELRHWIHAEHDRRFNGFADRRVLLEAFGASVSRDVGESAGHITVPTLLLAGERDDIAPVATQHELARRLPDARLVVVPGTGHLAHYETPEAVARAITDFLAILPPG